MGSKQSDAPDPAARNAGIDLLRATMVLYIVGFWHLLGYIGAGNSHVNWFTDALTNVILGTFVFVSGYLLGHWRDSFDVGGVLRFYARRGLRVYPLYLFALAAFTLTGLSDRITSVKAALLVAMFVPDPPMTLWFITMIMVFYLMTPLTASARGARLALIFVATLAFLWLFDAWINRIDVRIFMYYPAFVLGILARTDTGPLQFARARPLALLALFGGAMLVTSVKSGDRLLDAFAFVPAILSGAILALTLAVRVPQHGKIASLIGVLSYSSFSVYLFHRVVFLLAIRAYWPARESLQIAYLALVALPACILLSWLIQLIYDRCVARIANTLASPT